MAGFSTEGGHKNSDLRPSAGLGLRARLVEQHLSRAGTRRDHFCSWSLCFLSAMPSLTLFC